MVPKHWKYILLLGALSLACTTETNNLGSQVTELEATIAALRNTESNTPTTLPTKNILPTSPPIESSIANEQIVESTITTDVSDAVSRVQAPIFEFPESTSDQSISTPRAYPQEYRTPTVMILPQLQPNLDLETSQNPTPTPFPTSTPYPTFTPFPTWIPTSTPYPTYTPYPTWRPTTTPYPTYTPNPTATTSTAA